MENKPMISETEKRDGSVQVASLLEVHAISDYFIPCLLML